MHRQNDAKPWLVRPFPRKFPCYPAADIYLVALLYDHFPANDWLLLGSKSFGRCNRYVSMQAVWSDQERDGTFLGLALSIPFGILNG